MSAGCGFAHDDAAYVLGALSPAERLAFERHLATCATCAESVGRLAGLPGLLAKVPADVLEPALAPVDAAEPPPATLLPALLDRARRTERRRRRTVGLAAAAAVAAIAAASVAVVGGLERDPVGPQATPTSAVSTAPARQMTPLGGGGDAVTVAMTPVAWGTRLDLECRWAPASDAAPGYGDVTGGRYSLVVRSAGGQAQQVATWRALPGRTMRVSAATSLGRDEIAAVEVRAADGRTAFELGADQVG